MYSSVQSIVGTHPVLKGRPPVIAFLFKGISLEDYKDSKGR